MISLEKRWHSDTNHFAVCKDRGWPAGFHFTWELQSFSNLLKLRFWGPTLRVSSSVGSGLGLMNLHF